MATTAMVHVRVDEQIKEQATVVLAAMGLSVSDAVRVFLMRVVAEQQMPFALKDGGSNACCHRRYYLGRYCCQVGMAISGLRVVLN